jgi:uncharacterized protein YecE (DUF72 family)
MIVTTAETVKAKAGEAMPPYIGCSGWAIPRRSASRFPPGASHLARYAQVFRAVEVDSTFYRPPRPRTYARWAASVPPAFRFALKLPGEITHRRRLRGIRAPLARFLAGVRLGRKLGCLLVQLPPSLAFEPRRTEACLRVLRSLHRGPVVWEPRHASWFAEPAERLLRRYRIGRVAADPAVVPAAAVPGGWPGISYYRLHGSPRMYYSAYSEAALDRLARGIRRQASGRTRRVWCIFDNTASGAAIENALRLQEAIT